MAVRGLVGVELLCHVVEGGEGEAGVLGLLAFAVRVNGFGQLADSGLLGGRGIGEGEQVEIA